VNRDRGSVEWEMRAGASKQANCLSLYHSRDQSLMSMPPPHQSINRASQSIESIVIMLLIDDGFNK